MKISFFAVAVVLHLGFSFSAAAQALPSADFDSHFGIVCMDGNCPQFVGAMISRFDEAGQELIQCSTTLIAPDRVITNTHCIPEVLRKVGAACNEWTQIVFPASEGLQTESIACESIEAFAPISNGEYDLGDWTIVKLKKPTQRKPATISRQTLPLGQVIQGFPIFFNPLFPVGQIYNVSCTISELGYLFPQSFHPESASFFATGCNFLSKVGNSGTGFLNSQNQLVGLISAMVHQKFQTPEDAEANGSPNILGTKALCIPLDGVRPALCELNEGVDGFQDGTIMYSTLIAFAKGEKAAAIDTSQAPQSKIIHWQKATAENAPAYFNSLYGNLNFPVAEEFFKAKGFANIAEELVQKAADLLGSVPQCIDAKAINGGSDSIPFTIFNFRDYEVFPGDQGLYLHLAETKELDVVAKQVQLTVNISKVAHSSEFLVEYSGGAGAFELTSADQEYMSTVCAKEQAATQDQAQAPSVACQAIYKKWGFAIYLQNFSFKIPGC